MFSFTVTGLTSARTTPSYDQLLESNVQGIISTSFSLEELKEAIYDVLDNKPAILKEQYARATAIIHLSTHTYGLTQREIQILHLLSTGITDTDISQKLEISPKTVRTHLDRITLKLGARNRTHAVVTAISKNIISPYVEDF